MQQTSSAAVLLRPPPSNTPRACQADRGRIRNDDWVRSRTPFFESPLTGAVIDRVAEEEAPLLLYCGAGVTIDRTGHSWSALIQSCFPDRHSKNYPQGPRRADIEALATIAPEQLASSLVHTLRAVAAGSKQSLQDTLRRRIKRSLYGTAASWQGGELSRNIVQLALFRSLRGRQTTIFTTNYDDHIEQRYREIRGSIETLKEVGVPGLRVMGINSDDPVYTLDPLRMDPDASSAHITVVYLHGRVPSAGPVSWPIVLDENSYAATAVEVGAALIHGFENHPLSVIVGSSLQDLPLIRALSSTRRNGERLAVLTKGSHAHDLSAEGDSLSLDLLRDRAAELSVTPVFADFHGQVAQLASEMTLRTAFPKPRNDAPLSWSYMDRLDGWWREWSSTAGLDPQLPDKLHEALQSVLPLFDLTPNVDPLSTESERYRLELWVRAFPITPERQLVRWAASDSRNLDGAKGKCGPLDTASYLAPVRAFVEGRAGAYDIADLEQGRVSIDRYTSKAFLAVPIRARDCIVGVLTLASSNRIASARMTRASDTTEKAVAYLLDLGQRLLDA
ncbi:SIR2 family protein [Microbacterium sp. KSW4-16]|uniref:SIR2 family protein n=1 Tax=Microbacterium aurugineum TaxID=2851642 RepID=UPI0020BF6D93|nr:SIR2 family protein [Microbacterium aurugineum]MCK8467825.1 SIR2 family protein [Microbacterium aurugineum]